MYQHEAFSHSPEYRAGFFFPDFLRSLWTSVLMFSFHNEQNAFSHHLACQLKCLYFHYVYGFSATCPPLYL